MKATLTTSLVRVYDINEIMVITNQPFNLKLVREISDPVSPLKWFVDNDPVLSLSVDEEGLQATLMSEEVGTSTILIMNQSKQIVKELKITVVDIIPNEADVLEVQTEVIPK